MYDDVAKDNLLKFHARSNTILGVLFYKTAVCEGIAKTLKFLLNALDIKCIVVKGKATDDLSVKSFSLAYAANLRRNVYFFLWTFK